MSRRSKGPYLYADRRRGQWVIRDGAGFRRTGCDLADAGGAEKALAAYIGEKWTPPEHAGGKLGAITIDEVLAAYLRERAPSTRSNETIRYNTKALIGFWAGKTLASIKGPSCRDYVAARVASAATARRELETLQSAINHWHREHGPLDAIPAVTMPPKSLPRERWLTRSEAARLLAGALGWEWIASDVMTRRQIWRRHKAAVNRHTARFVLIGLYTGTRHAAILRLQWTRSHEGGWPDLARGALHRRGDGASETKKRQPATKMHPRLITHLTRWSRMDGGNGAVIHFDGEPITKMRRSWDTARGFACLDECVTPHILRHTRATWMARDAVAPLEASASLGMSLKTYLTVYGHHQPEWQVSAARSDGKGR